MLKLVTPNWPAPPNVKAFSTTRHGGASELPYASLNLGLHVGDNPEVVLQNRDCLPLDYHPCWLNQVHGTQVIEYTDSPVSLPDADGCYSNKLHQPCVVMTADCLPVLVTDTKGSFVAAIHCGWRGLAGGILEQFFNHLPDSESILVWLGPAIGPTAFEVGIDVLNSFPEQSIAFQPSDNGKYLANLYQLTRLRLERLGIYNVYCDEQCTFSNHDDFFSFRRDGVTGRMASIIWKD